MDNVVQNISIEDIIPSKFQPSNEDAQKIEELAQLIKTFGLIDPILVRPKNNKYEIILGQEKYQAAKLAGLINIPVLIKEVDDEAFSKYKNLDSQSNDKKNKNSTPSSNNNFTIPLEERTSNTDNLPHLEKYYTNNNQDIVSLAKLNQEEYERTDFKMNNEQLNNNMMNNNFAEPTPAMNNNANQPAFGGKFFPSLEDEPTNMNMGEMPTTNNFAAPNSSMLNNVDNNNLIDLTDISIEKQPTMDNVAPTIEIPTPQSVTPSPAMPQTPVADFSINQAPQLNNQNISMPQNSFEIPNLSTQPMNDVMSNTINIDDLPNMAPPVQSQAPINNLPNLEQPQFDLSQNMNINATPSLDINSAPNIPQNNIGINEPMMESPEIAKLNQQLNSEPPIMNQDFGINQQTLVSETPVVNAKDVTPVANTIKNLVSSLESFGYKININEEDLATSTKITIEIEK